MLKENLRGGGAGGNALRVIYLGNETADLEGFGRIPPQGGPWDDKETNLERTGRCMVVSPTGGRDGGGGITRAGDLRLPPPEHNHTVY